MESIQEGFVWAGHEIFHSVFFWNSLWLRLMTPSAMQIPELLNEGSHPFKHPPTRNLGVLIFHGSPQGKPWPRRIHQHPAEPGFYTGELRPRAFLVFLPAAVRRQTACHPLISGHVILAWKPFPRQKWTLMFFRGLAAIYFDRYD